MVTKKLKDKEEKIESKMSISEMLDRVKEKYIPIDQLKFDPQNARLGHLDEKTLGSQEKIEKYILEEQGINKLSSEIIIAKGITEPLIVNNDYTVKEGNRRLAALRQLNAKSKADEQENVDKSAFEKAPCKVLPPDADPIEVDAYVASLHVKGKKKWDAFDKAVEVYRFSKDYNLTYESIAKKLTLGKQTVVKYIQAYEATKKYSEKYPEDKSWWRKYTYFDELFKRKDLKAFSASDANVEKFIQWVHFGKFQNDVRKVRLLFDTLNDPEAKKAFDIKGIGAAEEILDVKNPALKSPYFKNIVKVLDFTKNIPHKELADLAGDPIKIALLEKLKKELTELLTDVNRYKPR